MTPQEETDCIPFSTSEYIIGVCTSIVKSDTVSIYIESPQKRIVIVMRSNIRFKQIHLIITVVSIAGAKLQVTAVDS